MNGRQQAWAWLEIPTWIFGVEACLDGMAVGFQTFAQFAQGRQITGRQRHHPAHQIHAPHLFGDTVFDLQTGVYFKEVETLGFAVEHKLHGAGAAVVHCLGQLDRCGTQLIGHAVGQVGRWGFFKDFLIATLDGAIAHAEGNDVTSTVAEHLDFKVAGALDVLLDKHASVAEVVLAKTFDRFEGFAQFRRAAADAHADAATAGGAFEHHRIADVFAGNQCRVEAVEQLGAFEHRQAMLFRQGACGVLEAEHPQLLWRRADERDVGRFAGFGERGVFRKEAVAGMDRRGAGCPGDGENLVDGQVRASGSAFAEAVSFIGLQDVQAGSVSFGIHGDAFDLQFTQGAQNAAGNGATVGNQDFFEHGITPGGDCASASTWDAGRPAVFR